MLVRLCECTTDQSLFCLHIAIEDYLMLFAYSNSTFSHGTARVLAHLSQRLIGELIVYPWSVVVVHNAQTSSSQKPLGQSKPNFMWSLLG